MQFLSDASEARYKVMWTLSDIQPNESLYKYSHPNSHKESGK